MVDVNNTAVVYWTQRGINTSSEPAEVVLEQNFTYPFIADASRYVLAIERFQINLNNVKFYDNSRGESITIVTVAGGATTLVQLATDAYDLLDFLAKVNTALSSIVSFPSGDFPDNMVQIDPLDGRIVVNWTAYSSYTITWPTYMNYILDLPNGAYNSSQTYSPSSRCDVGGDLQGLVLSSNMPVFSDTVGQAKATILTDIAVPTQFIMAYRANGGDGYAIVDPPQKVYYAPDPVRRFLNFSIPIPIYNIQIRASYNSIDGRNNPVLVPTGGMFEIKLGFYRKDALTAG